jgi:colanic acid/amylovoran biosynthesis protein
MNQSASNPVTAPRSPKPFTFVLLGAGFATGNMGVAALASGAIAAAAQAHPGARIYLLDYGEEPATYQVNCRDGITPAQLLNIRFSKKLFLPNNIARLIVTAGLLRLIPFRRLRERAILRNPCLKPLYEADMTGAIAGGDSFSDIYGLARLFYVSLPQLLILFLGKPLVVLPQTIGPFKTRLGRAVAKFILRRAERVYARDRTSDPELRQLLGSRASRLHFSYDVGFALEPARPGPEEFAWLAQARGRGALVGLNVSGLLLMGGYNRNNMFGLKSDYRDLVGRLVRYLVEEAGANVLLVPHVFGGHPESDTSACARLLAELGPEFPGRIHAVPGDLNQHEIKYIIGRCDFFIGSRMHACIAALSQCVPTACLAYSRKFIGVMESIGCSRLVADLDAMETKEILAAVARIYDSRADWRNFLKERMPEVQAGVLELFLSGDAATRIMRVRSLTPAKKLANPAPVVLAPNGK